MWVRKSDMVCLIKDGIIYGFCLIYFCIVKDILFILELRNDLLCSNMWILGNFILVIIGCKLGWNYIVDGF